MTADRYSEQLDHLDPDVWVEPRPYTVGIAGVHMGRTLAPPEAKQPSRALWWGVGLVAVIGFCLYISLA